MKTWFKHTMKISLPMFFLTGMAFSSCTDLIFDDREGCDRGVFINFKYDYNLQRADMFADHVGEVTLYVFDEQGNYVTSQSEGNEGDYLPLKDKDYSMYLDLPDGKYRFIALASQRKYEDLLDEEGAKFIRTDLKEESRMEDLQITLDYRTEADNKVYIAHKNMPLDTLWHAMSDVPVEISQGQYVFQTLSLVRDTKYISVTLRDIDRPNVMDINDYELYITGANIQLNYDNSAGNSVKAVCTPYVTWNTQDPEISGNTAVGNMGHADFMTSRIFVHENVADDEVLIVRNRQTGKVVIEVNLPDLLSRLCNYDELHRYSKQEFLDRGYDYNLSFFLSGDSWSYVNVSIGVLGWSKRVQNIAL